MVSKDMGLDGRIGNKFLHAGPGYGSSCFPKDTQALARMDQDHGTPMQFTEAVIKVNEEIKRRMVEKVFDICGGSAYGKVIAVLGVTWKDDTYAAVKGADAIVLLTEWNELRALDLEQIADSMANPVMADLRNIYTAKNATAAALLHRSAATGNAPYPRRISDGPFKMRVPKSSHPV